MFKEKRIEYTWVLQIYSLEVYKTQSCSTHLRWSKALDLLKKKFK